MEFTETFVLSYAERALALGAEYSMPWQIVHFKSPYTLIRMKQAKLHYSLYTRAPIIPISVCKLSRMPAPFPVTTYPIQALLARCLTPGISLSPLLLSFSFPRLCMRPLCANLLPNFCPYFTCTSANSIRPRTNQMLYLPYPSSLTPGHCMLSKAPLGCFNERDGLLPAGRRDP